MARFPRFLLGGAIGAGLALLFAPKPGRELRRLLMHGKRPAALPSAQEPLRMPAQSPPSTQMGVSAPSPNAASSVKPATPTAQPAPAKALNSVPTAPASEKPAAAQLEAAEKAPVDQFAVPTAAKQPQPAATAPVKPAAPAQPVPPAQTQPAVTPSQKPIQAAQPEKPAASTAEKPGTGGARSAQPEAVKAPEARPDQGGFDQEDMRRRIEETRARLKAKAFDALVSGETLIATENSKVKQPQKDEPQLEREVQDKVDQTFKELY